MEVCTCNPGTQEAKAEGLCTGGQLRTLSEILSLNKTNNKGQKEGRSSFVVCYCNKYEEQEQHVVYLNYS